MGKIGIIKKSTEVSGAPNEGGFTLTEVLVSLALIGLVLMVMSEFLYNGVAFYHRSDRAYQRQHQLKFIYQMLHHELENIYANPFLPENAFAGDAESMAFWRETPAGLEQIRYRFDPEARQVMTSRNLYGGQPQEKVIFKDIRECRFEFYDLDSANWVTVWEPSWKMEIPTLVRVDLTMETGKLGNLVFAIKPDMIEERE